MNNTSTHPILDFLVIGSQKSATSWLYKCLEDHPEIGVPAKKREVEYIGGELFKKGGYEWYEGLLDWSQPVIHGDVSVEYIVNPESAELIHKRYPNIKLILIVRDPIKRALSAYQWYLRKGSIEFDEQKALKAFEAAKEKYRAEDYQIDQYDFFDILHRGNYKHLLQPYLQYFKEDQIALLDHQDIEEDNPAALQFIYSFLGVQNDFIPPSLGERPKQNSNKKWLIWLERINPNNQILSGIIDRIHQWFIKSEGNKNKNADKQHAFYPLLNQFYGSTFKDFKKDMALKTNCMIFKKELWEAK